MTLHLPFFSHRPVAPLREKNQSPTSALNSQDQALVQSVSATASRKKKHFMFSGASQNEKIFFIDNLATMLNAGLSISLSLSTLVQEVKKKSIKRALRAIEYEVNNGGQLSESLANHPEIFPEHFVPVVKVGEASGALNEVLTRIAAIAKRDKTLKSKIINALIYPMIVVAAMIGIVVILMLYVFPQLIAIFEEVNVELPLQTRVLIAVVHFMQTNGLYVGAGALVLFAALIFGRKVPQVRYWYDVIFLRIPFIGRVTKEVVLVRILGNLKMLLESGVPIVHAFTIAAHTGDNLVYQRVLYDISRNLEMGKSLNELLKVHPDLFPTITVTMVKVGEETGKLDEVLGKLDQFYDERVGNVFSNLSTIIEPVLMLSIGAMVGFIAISVIMPIYDLAQAF